MQGRGPVGEGHGVAGAGLRAQRLLELVDCRSARHPVAAQYGSDRGDVVVVDELVAIRDHTSQFGVLLADLSR